MMQFTQKTLDDLHSTHFRYRPDWDLECEGCHEVWPCTVARLAMDWEEHDRRDQEKDALLRELLADLDLGLYNLSRREHNLERLRAEAKLNALRALVQEREG